MKQKMKLAVLAFMLAFAGMAVADTYTYTITGTNTQPITYSDPLPISGYLDKVEVVTDVASTTTVTLATYSTGNQAIDTYYSATISATTTNGTAVARTRVAPTDNGATAIAANGGASNVFAALSLIAPYEKPMIGGNVKCAVTFTKSDSSCPVSVTVFYEPINK